ncbi:MAG: hypothetical protein FWE04_03740 [Oscillospiraceae bacterium]|nr:hypothetical protein [Oscillospiraceae bacterium]
MNTYELVNEIIYYYKYFNIIEMDNEVLIAKEVTSRIESIIFIENLLRRLHQEIRLKRFLRDRKRLETFLIELENRKTMLFLDQFLEEKSQLVSQ